MVTTYGVPRSSAQPKVLWIGAQPISLGFQVRRVLPGVEITFQSRYEAALQSLRKTKFTAVVLATDFSIDGGRGQLEGIVKVCPNIPVIVWSALPFSNNLEVSTSLGAFQVITGDLDGVQLRTAVKNAVESVSRESEDEWESLPWRRFLIGNSPAMLQLCETIHLIASRRATVLISGETGTGKEVVARAVHAASQRSALAMVAVNCTALPANLVESELFGHSKGAFTGAHTSRVGRFEQAHRSSIFLDEIGDLPMEAQAKLLRVLQEQEFERVGSSETVRVDVRVIAASNVDLENAVRERRFREDLFYRLNVVPIRLPALRERREDIPVLLKHFVEKTRAMENAAPKTISDEAIEFLSEQEWPGNIRQLEHTVQMAFALSGNRPVLHPADFPIRQGASSRSFNGTAPLASHVSVGAKGIDFDEVVATFELSLLSQALAVTGGNKARAADLLKIKRTTLLAKMKVFEERTVCRSPAPALTSLSGGDPATNSSALVVEADNPIRRLMVKTLESQGYRVLTAASESDAQELLACWGEHIKVLIVSADNVAATFQSLYPNLRVLLLTSNSNPVNQHLSDSRRHSLQLPFSADDFTSAVNRLSSVESAELV